MWPGPFADDALQTKNRQNESGEKSPLDKRHSSTLMTLDGGMRYIDVSCFAYSACTEVKCKRCMAGPWIKSEKQDKCWKMHIVLG